MRFSRFQTFKRKKQIHPLRQIHLYIISFIIFTAGFWVCYQHATLQFNSGILNERDRMALSIDHIRNQISRELYATINLTHGLVAFIHLHNEISQYQFDVMAQELLSRNSLINNIGLAEGYMIRYVYPLKNNEEALGLDYRTNKQQIGAVERCIREKNTVIAGPVELVQGGRGILEHTPVFFYDSSDGSTRDLFWGVLTTVIRLDTLVEKYGLLSESENGLFTIALRGSGDSGEVIWGDSNVFSLNPVVLDIPLPAGAWQIAAVPRNGWPVFKPVRSNAFMIGLLITFIFAVLTFLTLHEGFNRSIELKRRILVESDLLSLNRKLKLISDCNKAIVHAESESDLYNRLCSIAVNTTGFPVAMVGMIDDESKPEIRPVVSLAGSVVMQYGLDFNDYREFLKIAGVYAVRSRRPVVVDDIAGNPDFAVCQDELVTKGFRSIILIPLTINTVVEGAIILFAEDLQPSEKTMNQLLDEMNDSISHGIAAMRLQKERNEAITALEKNRNQLEERVAERTSELLIAKEAAEAADRIKSAFLATMSHELRTPLNSIIGFTGIILQGIVGAISDEQRKQLNMVYDSSRHLLALINDVLDISKIESGQIELFKTDISIGEIIDKSINVIMPMATRKKLDVTVRAASVIAELYSDRRRVEQILINLLNNAVKFTEAGSIILTVDSAMNVSGKQVVRITVADTGIGISETDINELFKPFKQLDTGTTRRFEGTGLGLSICRKLAQLLGGDVFAESDGVGKGSKFSLELPVNNPRGSDGNHSHN